MEDKSGRQSYPALSSLPLSLKQLLKTSPKRKRQRWGGGFETAALLEVVAVAGTRLGLARCVPSAPVGHRSR